MTPATFPSRSTGIPLAAKGLSLGLIAVFLLSVPNPGSAPGCSPPREGAGPIPVPSVQAPQPRNLTFYMHNATIGKDVNGVTTPYIFDTLQSFGTNNTVSKVQEVRQDWYLFPTLAGSLALNGTITMHVFVSIENAGAQINPTLTVSEVNASGMVPWTYSNTFGSQSWWTTPHDLVLATPSLQHTFAAGSTVLAVVRITSGVRTATIWYNASWVPTHLVLQSDDFARVDDITFLDASGTPKVSFDPIATNKDIAIVVNVTDPLGGYDVRWVNLTLRRPGGTAVFSAQSMAKAAGTPLSFRSTYRLTWNYNGQPVGRYNATATVLDNSGYYHFLQFFDADGFLAAMDAFFYIGGLPVYVNAQAVDSKNAPVAGATIDLVSGGTTVDAKATDSNGLANFTMAKGSYEFDVFWQGAKVAAQAFDAASNVSAASPLVIVTQVFYPIFQTFDADGKILAGAALIFVHPRGQKLGPFQTNASGEVELAQVPAGTYGVAASWRGVDVFRGDEAVSGNAVITITTRVYELTVTAVAGDGHSLAGVFISVTDSTGLVFDAGVTGANGKVVLRLPAGEYVVNARYITSYLGSLYDSGVRSNTISLSGSTTVTAKFADFPIPIASTLEFQLVLLYVATTAALSIIVFLLWRRQRAGAAKAEPEEKGS